MEYDMLGICRSLHDLCPDGQGFPFAASATRRPRQSGREIQRKSSSPQRGKMHFPTLEYSAELFPVSPSIIKCAWIISIHISQSRRYSYQATSIPTPIQWLLGVFIGGVKRPQPDVNYSSPSSAEVKNEWSSTSNPCRCRHGFDRATSTLTLRWLMSYIYGAPILDVSRSHTTTQHSR